MKFYEEAYPLAKKTFGEKHMNVATIQMSLGALYGQLHLKKAEAIELLQSALKTFTEVVGN